MYLHLECESLHQNQSNLKTIGLKIRPLPSSGQFCSAVGASACGPESPGFGFPLGARAKNKTFASCLKY